MPTKEEQQRALNAKRKLRDKQIAQLRASNEMLEAAKANIIERYGEDSDTTERLLGDIDIAKEQNLERAQSYLGASKREVESMPYNKVNTKEEKAYYDRLKRQGKSDEELHKKDISKDTRSTAKTTAKPKSKLAELTEKLKKINSKTKDVDKEVGVMDEVPPEEIIAPNAGDITLKPIGETFDDIPLEDLGKPIGGDDKDVETPVEKKESGVKEVEMDKRVYDDFDPRDIPSYVQYDMIPLPSHGECYPHKKNTIPVAYLTAADENLIISPNLYNNGQFIDIMLDRKILDKSIRAKDLCNGDRDAIVLWLRATAYGTDYPIVATKNGEEFNTTVDLSTLSYYDFNLKGDENGWFDYTTGNGDLIKYKILTHSDEMEIRNKQINKINNVNAIFIVDECDKLIENINDVEGDGKADVIDAVKQVKSWAKIFAKDEIDESEADKLYSESITLRMINYTMSINGNTDREFIKNYINNMRANEAKKYREYVNANIPGVDLNIEVSVPESLGGGSFKSFLNYGEFVFINV